MKALKEAVVAWNAFDEKHDSFAANLEKKIHSLADEGPLIIDALDELITRAHV